MDKEEIAHRDLKPDNILIDTKDPDSVDLNGMTFKIGNATLPFLSVIKFYIYTKYSNNNINNINNNNNNNKLVFVNIINKIIINNKLLND